MQYHTNQFYAQRIYPCNEDDYSDESDADCGEVGFFTWPTDWNYVDYSDLFDFLAEVKLSCTHQTDKTYTGKRIK